MSYKKLFNFFRRAEVSDSAQTLGCRKLKGCCHYDNTMVLDCLDLHSYTMCRYFIYIIIIITVSVKHKILSLETFLSTHHTSLFKIYIYCKSHTLVFSILLGFGCCCFPQHFDLAWSLHFLQGCTDWFVAPYTSYAEHTQLPHSLHRWHSKKFAWNIGSPAAATN